MSASGASTLSQFQIVKYSFLTSFYVYYIVNTATTSLEALLFYPMDFKKLQRFSASTASQQQKQQGKIITPNEFLISAIMVDQSVTFSDLLTDQSDPLWRRLVIAQQILSEDQLQLVSRNELCGPPRLTYLLGTGNSFYENVRKMLAYQDFTRCVRCCKEERAELYVQGFDRIAFEAARLFNAVTIQLQLSTAHAIVEVLPPDKSPKNKSSLYPIGEVILKFIVLKINIAFL
jgi:hypothetical protein